MQELCEYIVRSLIGDDKEFDVVVNEKERSINLYINREDIGKVIGKSGKIAKAVRTIIKAAAGKINHRYDVEILERD
ncbi:MAG: KH domain-containing protein [Clostridia bacterium]|nr:KH domain-containing protein [Clostridia bacterium]